MNDISKKEAIELLRNCLPVCSAEFETFSDPDCDTRLYYTGGCVVSRDEYEYDADDGHRHNVYYRIFQADGGADIAAVSKLTGGYADADRVRDIKAFVTLYVTGPLTPALNRSYGWRMLSRAGNIYDNPGVREITLDDSKMVDELCAPDEEDTPFGKMEAESFHGCFDYWTARKLNGYRMFGVFEENCLRGLVTARYYIAADTAQLCDIYVGRRFRRAGYGKRLVKAALSLYPGKTYFYQVAKGNAPSFALAYDSGFAFSGAMLFLS